MPIIAVVGATIADIAVGAAGFGAALAGTASTLGYLEVVGAVGATLGAVGAVTHDKGLQTAGLCLGIGGVGALAASAGLLGDASAPLFGNATDQAASDAGDAEDAAAASHAGLTGAGASVGAVESNALPPIEGAGQDVIDSVTPGSDVANAIGGDITGQPGAAFTASQLETPEGINQAVGSTGDNLLSSAPGQGTGLINAPNATPPSPVQIAGGTSTTPVIAPKAPTAATSSAPSVPNVATPDIETVPGLSKAVGLDTGSSSTGGLLNWLSNTKGGSLATYGLIQTAGSFINGAFGTLTPVQVAAYNAQAAANNDNAAMTNKQVANMNQPLPTATRTPDQTGLINTAPLIQTQTEAAA